MLTKKKKTALIILIISIVYSIFGFFLFNITLQSVVKLRMKYIIKSDSVDKSQITLLSFLDNDIQKFVWCGEDEFYWEGKMYDIIKRMKIKNILYYLCIYDAGETKFVNSLAQYIDDIHDSDSEALELQIVVSSWYISANARYVFDVKNWIKSVKKTVSYTNFLKEVGSPPPKPAEARVL